MFRLFNFPVFLVGRGVYAWGMGGKNFGLFVSDVLLDVNGFNLLGKKPGGSFFLSAGP